MPKANLRAVDNERLHPRDAARKAVKAFRLDREKEKFGVCNQIDSGAPSLRTDEILKRSEPHYLVGKK